MTKKEFLSELERQLRKLPKHEIDDILQDYQEYFALGIEDGKTESQIIEGLGSPKQLAKELLANYHIEKMETSTSARSIFSAVWAVIGLGFFNVIIVLGPFLGLLGALVGLWIFGFSGVISPFIVIASALFHPGTFAWFDVFVSITFCGLGILFCIGMYFVTIGLKNGFLRYLKYNVSLVKGGTKHD